ncbi:MAG: gamma-glutamyltransferase family protein [Candidatus Methanomethylicia archaeon]
MYLRAPFYSVHGVVASESPLASSIGANILRSGGNAIDATVAVGFTLGVVLPHLSGLGGDFFAIIRDPNGNVHVINGSGYSPKNLTVDYMRNLGFTSMPIHSVYSITIPGMVDGLYGLWRAFGSMEWSDLLAPSIKLAEEGFPAHRSFCRALRNFSGELIKDIGSRTTYCLDAGFPNEGDILSFKGLAQALRLIAEDARNFYEGDIAVKIVDYIKSLGGVMELDDLKYYHSEFQQPIKIDYKGWSIYEMPPNSQGITTLHILKLIENVMFSSIPLLSMDRVQCILEASVKAYKVRDHYVSDPRFMSVSVDKLLSEEFLENLRKQDINDRGYTLPSQSDTTYFAIADDKDYIVSCIQSIFHNFGSYITEPTYNITLNSRGSSFTLTDNHVNKLEPMKKPLHTLSATLINYGSRWMAMGLSGGHLRPLLHAQIINCILDYGLHPQLALETPRFRWEPGGINVECEKGYISGELKGFKYRIIDYPSRIGVASIVEVRDKLKIGYTDIRGDGLPIGLE